MVVNPQDSQILDLGVHKPPLVVLLLVFFFWGGGYRLGYINHGILWLRASQVIAVPGGRLAPSPCGEKGGLLAKSVEAREAMEAIEALPGREVFFLGPAIGALLRPFFFGWEGSLAKMDYRKKLVPLF